MGVTHTTSNFALRLPTDLYQTLRAEAFARNTSVNAIITSLVAEHLKANRAELIDLIGQAANERYAVALDKLADL